MVKHTEGRTVHLVDLRLQLRRLLLCQLPDLGAGLVIVVLLLLAVGLLGQLGSPVCLILLLLLLPALAVSVDPQRKLAVAGDSLLYELEREINIKVTVGEERVDRR